MFVSAPTRYVATALALASLGLAFPTGAGAKVGCEERYRPQKARVELVGLPRDPEAGRTYRVTAELSRKHAVNPRPLLFLLRCKRREYGPRYYSIDTGSAEIPGSPADEGGYAFEVRFDRPGHWLVASMDLAGRFRDFGLHRVGPQQDPQSQNGDTDLEFLLLGAGVLAAAAAALALGRRRSWLGRNL